MGVKLIHEWNPPAEGSDERKKMPKDAFLSPSDRTFPYKKFENGKWVPSKEGLKSAIALANLHNHPVIASKASKLLDELFPDEITHSSFDDLLVCSELSDMPLNDFISHYGILGMKWGVRRDVGPDGLVKRSGGSQEHREARALSRKGVQNLTNAELRQYNERMNLEQQARNLSRSSVSSGQKIVTDVLKTSGKTAATTLATAALVYGGKQVVSATLGEEVMKAMFAKKK